ncbi:hypothetical protein M0R19_03045 [Candidatus Pacearchaeota archaeon]|nr:hypothetical protein [Candidatus Pacearchaeota archaeon]
MRMMKSLNLLTPFRSDIIPKYTYIKFLEENIQSIWGKELYIEHLRNWNNLFEINPRKVGEKEYIDSFMSIMNSIKEKGFDKSISIIPVYQGKMLNGSHRVASSIYFNKDVETKESFLSEGQIDCSFDYFKNRGLSEEYLDYMVYQYCLLKKNTFVICLFPSARKYWERIKEVIENKATYVFSKRINFTLYGLYNLMESLYHNEQWLFGGCKNKINFCFPNKDVDREMQVVVVESDLENIKKIKGEFREISKIENHSIHINDTYEQTLRNVSMFFNKNSIEFMNTSPYAKQLYLNNFYSQNFKTIFDRFEKINELKTDKVCVTSSAVLSAYNIRDCRDIDYLYHGEVPPYTDNNIDCHNKEKDKYPGHIDGVIYNPKNYFSFFGIKFMSIRALKIFKSFRKEEKDLNDLRLMKRGELNV